MEEEEGEGGWRVEGEKRENVLCVYRKTEHCLTGICFVFFPLFVCLFFLGGGRLVFKGVCVIGESGKRLGGGGGGGRGRGDGDGSEVNATINIS